MSVMTSSHPETVAESNLPCQLPPPPGFRDTAFTENHDVALHRWVPWIAGFSGSFVAGVLDTVRQRGKMRVLDPFAGVGTTLIEALKKGDDTIGFEINPYAALACKVKAGAGHYDVANLDRLIARFEAYGAAQSWLHTRPASARPAGFRSRSPFFSDAVERQVLACLDFVAAETADWLQDLFHVAFGSVMVSFSNYTYEPSLGTRAGAGKPDIDDADVFDIVRRKLQEMRDDIVKFQGWLAKHKPVPRATVYPLSYLDHAHRIEPRSIDVLITSPPYLNNYHYIRNTRPHLFWLGLAQAPADLKTIERPKLWVVLADGAGGSAGCSAAGPAAPGRADRAASRPASRKGPLRRLRLGQLCRCVLQRLSALLRRHAEPHAFRRRRGRGDWQQHPAGYRVSDGQAVRGDCGAGGVQAREAARGAEATDGE